MDQAPEDESEDYPTQVAGGIAKRMANLRPPWRPGESGNPSGLAKDGSGTKAHALRARLLAKLAKPAGQRTTKTWADRVVDGWVKAAADGDAAARRDILERLDPIDKDHAQGRVILEGIRLEIRGGGASLTMGAQGALPELPLEGTPTEAPRDAEVVVDGESFADEKQ